MNPWNNNSSSSNNVGHSRQARGLMLGIALGTAMTQQQREEDRREYVDAQKALAEQVRRLQEATRQRRDSKPYNRTTHKR